MEKLRSGRRRVLGSGLAALVAAPPASATRAETVLADDHAPLRAAFLAWLQAAQGRLVLPISVRFSPSRTDLLISGVHPAVGISLVDQDGFCAFVEWAGMLWDSWLWVDVFRRAVPGGWENEALLQEYRAVHGTMEQLWTVDIFEPLLDWINGELSRATHIALWGTNTGWTEAELIRGRRLPRSDRPIGTRPMQPAFLLPAHGHAAEWV